MILPHTTDSIQSVFNLSGIELNGKLKLTINGSSVPLVSIEDIFISEN